MNKKPIRPTSFLIALLFVFSILLIGCGSSGESSDSPSVVNELGADPEILAETYRIKAIDNHAHPLKVVNAGDTDTEYDALNYHGAPLSEPVIPFRLLQVTEYLPAWQTLYGYPYSDATPEHMQELIETKKRIKNEQGDNYPSFVLDRLGVETMVANRVVMGRGLPSPRFFWVSYADALMFPLSNETAKQATPDYKSYYESEERVMASYLANLRMSALPPTLDEYLATVVAPTLESQKRDGAVAVKFEAAYLRSLDFGNPPEDQARRVYAQYIRGGEPPANEYKALQDYLFRFIARKAGSLGLIVHIHTGFGIGGYFSVDGSNPLLLEPLFNDQTLRGTKFVLIHGGWPFQGQVAPLLLKPNVWADFSSMAFLIYPRELSGVIRSWLEMAPDKVMFGTDGIEIGRQTIGWEELCWIGTNSSRQALASALTGMMNDGEIRREKAMELAGKVLRGNAIDFYTMVSVSPSSGGWTSSPQNLSVNSSGATTIYYSMVSTYDGSTPADPAAPTPSSHTGSISGSSGTFPLYGSAGKLMMSKLRFTGCNTWGCGTASGSFSYSIDLRQ